MSEHDHYAVLGVRGDATTDEVKKAFRRLARELHPDVNPDPKTQERFKEINAAYEVLSDPEKRRRYDAGPAERPAGSRAGAGPSAARNDDVGDPAPSPFVFHASRPARFPEPLRGLAKVLERSGSPELPGLLVSYAVAAATRDDARRREAFKRLHDHPVVRGAVDSIDGVPASSRSRLVEVVCLDAGRRILKNDKEEMWQAWVDRLAAAERAPTGGEVGRSVTGALSRRVDRLLDDVAAWNRRHEPAAPPERAAPAPQATTSSSPRSPSPPRAPRRSSGDVLRDAVADSLLVCDALNMPRGTVRLAELLWRQPLMESTGASGAPPSLWGRQLLHMLPDVMGYRPLVEEVPLLWGLAGAMGVRHQRLAEGGRYAPSGLSVEAIIDDLVTQRAVRHWSGEGLFIPKHPSTSGYWEAAADAYGRRRLFGVDRIGHLSAQLDLDPSGRHVRFLRNHAARHAEVVDAALATALAASPGGPLWSLLGDVAATAVEVDVLGAVPQQMTASVVGLYPMGFGRLQGTVAGGASSRCSAERAAVLTAAGLLHHDVRSPVRLFRERHSIIGRAHEALNGLTSAGVSYGPYRAADPLMALFRAVDGMFPLDGFRGAPVRTGAPGSAQQLMEQLAASLGPARPTLARGSGVYVGI